MGIRNPFHRIVVKFNRLLKAANTTYMFISVYHLHLSITKVPPSVFSGGWKCRCLSAGEGDLSENIFPHLLSGIIVVSLIEVSSGTELQP